MSGTPPTSVARAGRAAADPRGARLVGVARVAVVLGAVLGVGGTAQARRADLDPDTEIAKRHFAIGVSAYNAGSYVAALKEFEAAHEVKPLPAFEFNIARCLDRLERFEEALAAYRRFVAHTSNRGEGEEAHRRIKVLEERLARRAPAESAAPPAPTRPHLAPR
jgi:tetratricopeptide (TPR) repeat protein